MRVKRCMGTALALSLGLAASCKSSDTATDAGTEAGTLESSNPLALMIPTSLAVTLFPTSADSALALGEDEDEAAELKKDGAEVKLENTDRLKGKSDCFPEKLLRDAKAGTEDCYEFDNDFNLSTYTDNGQSRSYGTLDGNNSTGEACIVAKGRSEVKEMKFRYEMINTIVGAGLCEAAKAEDTAAPVVGTPKDLKKHYEKALTPRGMEVESAEGEAFEDGTYKLTLKIKDHNGNPRDITSSKKIVDGLEYGVVNAARQLKVGARVEAGLTDPNNSDNKFELFSVRFEAKENGGVSYRMLTANKEKSLNKFTEAGEVDFSDLADTASNETIHAISFVSFEGNSDTGAGKLAYWKNPGGNLNESARGFNFDSTAGDDGFITGCAITGAAWGVSIRANLADAENKVLTPTQAWHPRAGQNTHANKDSRYAAAAGTNAPIISEQCFYQDADGYHVDAKHTTRGYDVIEAAESDIQPPKPPVREFEVK